MSASDPRRFGLLGHPLGHSLSPEIHDFFLRQVGQEGSYALYDTPPERLGETVARLRGELAGWNCTIPHKRAILAYLDAIDPAAARYGAVNTVRNRAGRLEGFNSDGPGFRAALAAAGLRLDVDLALVVGAGGVARMLAFEAALEGAETWVAARDLAKAEALRDETAHALGGRTDAGVPVRIRAVALSDLPAAVASGVRFGLLLQATPVGMWPETAGLPVPLDVLDGVDAVYDTIYNPLATRLVLAARRRGIPAAGGLGMLVEQGAVSFRLWNPDLPDPLPPGDPARVSLHAALRRAILSRSPLNLVLAGFMGSGKTTVGQALARHLDVEFIDLDALVEQRTGRTVPDLFRDAGEPAFRRLEREALASLACPDRTRIVATGGGALLSDEAVALVREGRGLTVLLDASIGAILERVGNGSGRPLLAGPDPEARAKALWTERRPRYLAAADAVVPADGSVARVVEDVLSALGLEPGPVGGVER
jgi:shikimate dehydrogenase